MIIGEFIKLIFIGSSKIEERFYRRGTYLWKEFFAADINEKAVKKKAKELQVYRENILPIDTDRKKYLLEKILEHY